MCGRYHISDDSDIEEIEKILEEINNKYKDSGATAKTGEIFPTNNVPVLSMIEGKPSLNLMTWGFPQWDKKGVTINARSETAAEKKMFAKPLIERRCVIPSTGFYEWSHDTKGKSKDKFLFNMGDSPMLYMAGLYTNYTNYDKENAMPDRFVILTRDANQSISDIHNRMPVILHKNELVRWMMDYDFAADAMRNGGIMLLRKAV